MVNDPNATEIPDEAIARGTALADWFAAEARRVYAILGESDEDQEQRQLVELIQRRGGSVTPRDFMRSSRLFANTNDAEVALGELVKAGMGRWEHDDHDGGRGRPVRRFTLVDTVAADTNTKNIKKNHICVNVNTVNSADTKADDSDWGEL